MRKISQNNDSRGRHLEFYAHTGIGNWFQCFPVSSVSIKVPVPVPVPAPVPDSGFRLFHTPIKDRFLAPKPESSKKVIFLAKLKKVN